MSAALNDPVQLERTGPSRLVVRVRGVLDGSTGAHLFAALREALTAEIREVVLDLRWVSDDDDAGHAALLKTQALIANSERRSAHIVIRPRTRSLVMRVCQELQDDGARPVPSETMADAWLSSPDQLGFAEASFAQAEQLFVRVRGHGGSP